MTSEMKSIAILMAFCLLLLVFNLRASQSHWTGRLLKIGTFWLMVVVLAVLTYKVYEVAVA